MKTTVEKLEKNKVVLHIEVDKDQIDAAMDKAYKKTAPRVSVPGFRKGKAPRAIIERYIGKEALFSEALDVLAPDVYRQAVQESGIEPVDRPDIDLEDMVEGQSLKLKATVEVMPEVTLHQYKGLSVDRNVRKITDEMVDQYIDQMRAAQAELVTADHDTVAQGDYVLIDYTGFINGKPFSGGAATGRMVHVGSGEYIPGFEEQLVGARIGEDVTLNVTFPEEYNNKKLAGKKAEFKVKVHEIKTRRLPEPDDDFAKSVGEYETIAELRDRVRRDLEQQAQDAADNQMRSALLSVAAANAEVDVPVALVKQEVDRRFYEFGQRLVYQGIDPTPLMAPDSAEAASLKESMEPQARTDVRERLVLEAIADKEGIVIAPDEVESEIEKRAAGDTAHADEIRAMYATPERRESLSRSMRLEKALALLVDTAVITEKMVDEKAQAEGQDKDA